MIWHRSTRIPRTCPMIAKHVSQCLEKCMNCNLGKLTQPLRWKFFTCLRVRSSRVLSLYSTCQLLRFPLCLDLWISTAFLFFLLNWRCIELADIELQQPNLIGECSVERIECLIPCPIRHRGAHETRRSQLDRALRQTIC